MVCFNLKALSIKGYQNDQNNRIYDNVSCNLKYPHIWLIL